MSEILDLSIYEEDTLDIKTPKGNVLHVKKPTEELAIKFIGYQTKAAGMSEDDIKDEETITKLMNMLKNLVKSILNNNKDNIEITDEWLKENDINYAMEIAILNAFTKFMSEITSNPNCSAPQNQARKKKVGK
ncbi:hypothetical protein NL50_17235 [Clostridium acetobutylicum]|nr:hypothetical protein NL50_17235 [Clostridium acetobutylicum]